jgi:hypothetical protein
VIQSQEDSPESTPLISLQPCESATHPRSHLVAAYSASEPTVKGRGELEWTTRPDIRRRQTCFKLGVLADRDDHQLPDRCLAIKFCTRGACYRLLSALCAHGSSEDEGTLGARDESMDEATGAALLPFTDSSS